MLDGTSFIDGTHLSERLKSVTIDHVLIDRHGIAQEIYNRKPTSTKMSELELFADDDASPILGDMVVGPNESSVLYCDHQTPVNVYNKGLNGIAIVRLITFRLPRQIRGANDMYAFIDKFVKTAQQANMPEYKCLAVRVETQYNARMLMARRLSMFEHVDSAGEFLCVRHCAAYDLFSIISLASMRNNDRNGGHLLSGIFVAQTIADYCPCHEKGDEASMNLRYVHNDQLSKVRILFSEQWTSHV